MLFLFVVALSTTVSTAFVSPPPSFLSLPSDIIRIKANPIVRSNNNINNIFRLYASTAPSKNAISMIDTWKLMPDGRIKGVISPDGDNVLTSPLKNLNGLRETATIQTVSGSRYLLGTPDTTPTDNKLSAYQLGVPREILGGGGGGEEANNKYAATLPLISTPTTSQDRVLQNYLANRERATVPLSSSGRTDPTGISKKKNDLLTVRSLCCVYVMIKTMNTGRLNQINGHI